MAEEKKTTAKAEPKPKAPPLNVWQRLATVRTEFRKELIKKSGKNPHAEFLYYELKDIVPIASEIMDKLNCMFVITFTPETATGRFLSTENPDDLIEITIPNTAIAEPAKFRMNEIQATGAGVTYFRRYLYALLLDLTDRDDLDGGETVRLPEAPKTQAKPKPPATPAKRNELKKEMTASNADADELQIQALKNVLKELKAIDPSQEEFIQEIAIRTNKFTDISKAACENLILTVGEMIEHVQAGA